MILQTERTLRHCEDLRIKNKKANEICNTPRSPHSWERLPGWLLAHQERA